MWQNEDSQANLLSSLFKTLCKAVDRVLLITRTGPSHSMLTPASRCCQEDSMWSRRPKGEHSSGEISAKSLKPPRARG